MNHEERSPRFDSLDRLLIGLGIAGVMLFLTFLLALWVASLMGPKGD